MNRQPKHALQLLTEVNSHFPWRVQDRRVLWYDLDLSTKPYKALKYHQLALRAVAFHRSYPLFASASDDGTIQIFHGMVYQVCSPSRGRRGSQAAAARHMHVHETLYL